MAEILLSLTIIGVVAAITLPSLTGNINERTWNTQRKALYSRISQAISLMPSLNGYGQYKPASGNEGDEDYIDGVDTATETFITDGLAKVMKINNICDSEHIHDCGIASSIVGYGNSVIKFDEIKKLTDYNFMFSSPYSVADTNFAAFETSNGESIVVYYNPYCTSFFTQASIWFYTSPAMCANFIYDLNGTKGPNTYGKDIGYITAFYPTDSVVLSPLVLPNEINVTFSEATKQCKEIDSLSRLPNRLELASMFMNLKLVNMPISDHFSVPQVIEDGVVKVWKQGFCGGRGINAQCLSAVGNGSLKSRCVR